MFSPFLLHLVFLRRRTSQVFLKVRDTLGNALPSVSLTQLFVAQMGENGNMMKEDADCSLSLLSYSLPLISRRLMPTVPARLSWTNTFLQRPDEVEATSSIKGLKIPRWMKTDLTRIWPVVAVAFPQPVCTGFQFSNSLALLWWCEGRYLKTLNTVTALCIISIFEDEIKF